MEGRCGRLYISIDVGRKCFNRKNMRAVRRMTSIWRGLSKRKYAKKVTLVARSGDFGVLFRSEQKDTITLRRSRWTYNPFEVFHAGQPCGRYVLYLV